MSVYYDGGVYQYWFGGGKSDGSYGVAGLKIKRDSVKLQIIDI